MPSTRITIVNFSTKGRASKEIVVKSSRHDDLIISPAAELLIDTIQCIRTVKVNVPRAFLLTGPPGVGKTHSVRLAVEASRNQGPTQFLSLQGSELLSASSHPAEAAKALNQHFQKVVRCCEHENHVGIVFIDECEALLSSDSVAAMFGSLLDKISCCSTDNGWQQIVIVVATNRIDAVPAWLRRPGRLDREIALGPPDSATRLDILKHLLKTSTIQSSEGSKLLNEEGLRSIAEACVGYVPADLAALVRRAALLAFQEDTEVTAEFLKRAMADVGASVSDRNY